MKRKYGIDILRILVTFFIIILHIDRRGLFNSVESGSTYYKVILAMDIICFVAVNVYGIVSGYVSYASYENKPTNEYKFKKLVYLWLIVFFYGLITYIVGLKVGLTKVSPKTILTLFTIVSYRRIWYFSAYFLLFFFMPIINMYVKKTDNKMLLITLISFFLTYSVYQSFSMRLINDFTFLNAGYSVWWLALLYYLGACIKKINLFGRVSNLALIASIIGLYIVTYLWTLYMPKIQWYFGGALYSYYSPNYVLIAICYLVLFSRINIKNKFLVNWVPKISAACFGVYVMHVHPIIWDNIEFLFSFIVNYNVYLVPLITIGIAFIALLEMLSIDIVREMLFRILKIDKFAEFIEKVMHSIIELISRVVDYEE